MSGGVAGGPFAVFGNYAERPQRPDAPPWIRGYTDRLSYAPGDRMAVHVNTNAPRFSLTLARDGLEPTLVHAVDGIPGAFHPTPEDCSVSGCGWPCALTVAVGDWRSGGHLLTLRTEVGARYDHVVVIRAARPARLLLVAATSSWTAYNDFGGSNSYEGVTGPDRDRFSPVLSTLRPQARGFAVLPSDAPRVTLAAPPAPMAPVRYPHMEWARATGHSKKYASAGWASYERHFALWAEREGLALDVATQTDLHQIADLLTPYACVVFVGHDEYWSWEMRDAVDAYVDQGGRVARFAGNFLWQIRLEADGTRQVCHKYRSDEDPVRGARNTGCWDSSEVGRPGAATFGLDATRGLYAGWGGCVSRGARGFPVYRPEHWAFAGTGLHYGDVLGAASHAFGYEVDGLDYVMRDGLPYPADPAGVPAGLQILALGLSSLLEEGEDVDPALSFLTREDAEYIARATGRTVEQTRRGSGMVVAFRRGLGEVFHAGSCEWVAGLLRGDPFVGTVTRTVLTRFLTEP